MLLDTAEIMNSGGVTYFLDAGALLGLVRDGDLIPWDDDVDLLMPANELPKFRQLYFRLRLRGWRVSEDSFMRSDGPGWKKGDLRSIKIRNRNIFFFGRGRMVMDVSLIYKHDGRYWRGAMGKIWWKPGQHFDQCDFIKYSGKQIHIPYQVDHYLTFLYGNWKTPDKDYDPVGADGGLYGDLGKWEKKSASLPGHG